MNLFVGTSGFSYKEWKGSFYPKDLSDKQMLHYYAERFGTVEINNTFYRMPKENVLESWAADVPERFRRVNAEEVYRLKLRCILAKLANTRTRLAADAPHRPGHDYHGGTELVADLELH